MRHLIWILIFAFAHTNCSYSQNSVKKNNMTNNEKKPAVYSKTDSSKVEISDEEWKKILPSDVYNIAREKGTERAFTGKFWDHKEGGTYYCAACGNPLFNSNGKFESNCG